MAYIKVVLVVLLTILEKMKPVCSVSEDQEDSPLSKSFGFSITKRFADTFKDAKLNQKYMAHYQEVLKGSQESFEGFGREERSMKRVGSKEDQDPETLLEAKDRRRNGQRFQSEAGRRREKTQAIRRQKLHSQSLNSHRQHSKRTKNDY